SIWQSALPIPVGHVVLVGSEKQVVRADTRGVVTVMADTHADRYGTVVQNPGEAMSHVCLSIGVHRTVSPLLVPYSADPLPAVISLSHVSPEPLLSFLGDHPSP